ncbi:MAG: DUF1385 domain-containing protein [Oscillospiraceae bacterium]|nr:DUF1385 domain-containing protein [Oscillospiraceae bacterium]
MSEQKNENCCKAGFRTSIGGQALIEGVMMRGPVETAMAVRTKEGEIVVENVQDSRDKAIPKILRLPVVRGLVNFAQTMILGYKSIMRSAELAGIDDEDEGEPSKLDKFLTEKLGEKLFGIIGVIAMVLGVVLAVALFVLVPTALVKLFNTYVFNLGSFTAVFEGLIKIAVFVGYIATVSLMPDIRRTFEYHGAEHKTIACYEAGEELTSENAKKYSRFHPRCGTSFILIVLIVSIIVFLAVPSDLGILARFGLRILMLPLVVGIGYEIIKLVGRHDNTFTRIVSAPGLWLQRLTTREPDDLELEVAIEALRAVMPQDKEEAQW